MVIPVLSKTGCENADSDIGDSSARFCSFRLVGEEGDNPSEIEISFFGGSFIRSFARLARGDFVYERGASIDFERPDLKIGSIRIYADQNSINSVRDSMKDYADDPFDNRSYFEYLISNDNVWGSLALNLAGGASHKTRYLVLRGFAGSLPSIGIPLQHLKSSPFIKLTFTPRNIRIFNVGQACYSVVGNGKGAFIAADIGFPLPSQRDPLNIKEGNDLKIAKDDLRSRDFKAFILSHYDYDHISGFRFLSLRQIINAQWYLFDPTNYGMDPNKKLSNLAKSMLLLLSYFRNANLVRTNVDLLQNTNAVIKLFPGRPCGKLCCTRQNQLGLSTIIDSKSHTAFLPGDSMYEAWDIGLKSYLTKADLCLVPHHGASISSCSFQKVYGHYAVFCYGTHNSYGHPCKNHVHSVMSLVGQGGTFASPFFRKTTLIYSFKTGGYYWK